MKQQEKSISKRDETGLSCICGCRTGQSPVPFITDFRQGRIKESESREQRPDSLCLGWVWVGMGCLEFAQASEACTVEAGCKAVLGNFILGLKAL